MDLNKASRAASFHPPQDSSVGPPRSEAPNLGVLRASVMKKRLALVAMDMSPAVRTAIEKLRRAVSIGGEFWMFGKTEASCDK